MTVPEETPLCFLCRDAVSGNDPRVFHCAEPACTCALHTPGCLQDYIRAHVLQKGGPLLCPFEHVMPVRYRKHVHWHVPQSLGSCLWMIVTRLLLAALAYSDRGVYALVALVAYVLSRVVGFYRLLPERPVSVRLFDLEMIAYVLGYILASLIDVASSCDALLRSHARCDEGGAVVGRRDGSGIRRRGLSRNHSTRCEDAQECRPRCRRGAFDSAAQS